MKQTESTTAKVLGFNGKIGKSVRKFENGKLIVRTKQARELMSEPMFTGACIDVARILGKPLASLISKRQASKFYRGCGIVYETITKKQAADAS